MCCIHEDSYNEAEAEVATLRWNVDRESERPHLGWDAWIVRPGSEMEALVYMQEGGGSG